MFDYIGSLVVRF